MSVKNILFPGTERSICTSKIHSQWQLFILQGESKFLFINIHDSEKELPYPIRLDINIYC